MRTITSSGSHICIPSSKGALEEVSYHEFCNSVCHMDPAIVHACDSYSGRQEGSGAGGGEEGLQAYMLLKFFILKNPSSCNHFGGQS